METTIPSYLTARPSRNLRRAADQASTKEWWETKRHEYELFTSVTVEEEAGEGDPEMAAARLRCLEGLTFLRSRSEVDEFTRHLLDTSVIPSVAALDATHIALSAVHAMDFLLTWNCKHINNPYTIRRIERICTERGLTCPVICTPNELLPNVRAVEPNAILEEIRQTREKIARECDFDVRKMMDRFRARERELEAQGVKFVSFAKKAETK